MCIIIIVPKGETITKKELKNAWETNPDGGGFAYNSHGRIYFQKGFMNFKAYWNAIKNLIGKVDLVLHMRIATNPTINKQQTHPYKLGNPRKLKGITKQPVICMNGIIHNQHEYKNMNDTMSYIKDHRQAFEVINQDILNIIESDTESKWAVITMNDIILSSRFIKSDGKYYSNQNHKYQTFTTDINKSMEVSDVINERLLDEIINKAPELYLDVEDYVNLNCKYEDVCQWCNGECLYDLKTIDEIKDFIQFNMYGY
jgi:hypothetical protein